MKCDSTKHYTCSGKGRVLKHGAGNQWLRPRDRELSKAVDPQPLPSPNHGSGATVPLILMGFSLHKDMRTWPLVREGRVFTDHSENNRLLFPTLHISTTEMFPR